MVRTPESTAVAPRKPEAGMTRWNPWDELAEMRRHLDEIFARPFGFTPLSRLIPSETMEFEPPVDIYESADMVTMYVALPGYTAENIQVEVQPESVSVTGEKKPIVETDKAVPYRTSGLVGSTCFSIAYSLPAEIDTSKVSASFKEGMLVLEMPKTEVEKAKTVKVKVASK